MFRTIATSNQAVNLQSRLVGAMLSVLLLLSVVLNVSLARKVASLKDTLRQANDYGQLKAGDTVPEIEGLSLDGSRRTVFFGEVAVPTVLYVFTPQCSWCKENLPNLHALIDGSNNSSSADYRVLGVSLNQEGLAQYVKDERLTFPVYSDLSAPVRSAYHMVMTPTTIVVSPDRKVLKVWMGAYQEETFREIQAYLHITMPGTPSRNR
jgi:peroxiredoxin